MLTLFVAGYIFFIKVSLQRYFLGSVTKLPISKFPNYKISKLESSITKFPSHKNHNLWTPDGYKIHNDYKIPKLINSQ
jgi:hypothetical protein